MPHGMLLAGKGVPGIGWASPLAVWAREERHVLVLLRVSCSEYREYRVLI